MLVTFISECEKKAHKRTRRVLDAFANRIGSNTWQTPITEEGLDAVKKLLRQTASKNTAISCHQLKSRIRTELLWIVGNRDKFNNEGVVAVNYTEQDKFIGEEVINKNIEVIAILSKIAGFFHDIGKANNLFQNKLDKSNRSKNFEPYRHEWVSLVLFKTFVGDKSDKDWLQELTHINNKTERELLKKLDITKVADNQFKDLSPVAKIIAWLIVSHHRLPAYPKDEKYENNPKYKNINNWLNKEVDVLWNATHHHKEWKNNECKKNWEFTSGTPFRSVEWQKELRKAATNALLSESLFKQKWLEQRFISHISRLCVMLPDHYYSSLNSEQLNPDWRDHNYHALANATQRLDEHNIGVGKNAYLLAQSLPTLKKHLPCISITKKFTHSDYQDATEREFYGWQDEAYQLAKKIKNKTTEHGFFGINMASTGRGKTIANARIMSALSDKDNCRISIALGLRTLTLQTGKALVKDLVLKKGDCGVLIGSQAVKELYDLNQDEKQEENNNGSASAQDLGKGQEVIWNGVIDNEILEKWLDKSPKLQKLIAAPLLVSTIDHLIPATEGVRGGKQIAPMLRLFTSDLILDEPDDFGLEDLPALCRLVNWAGMLGSKVLLSTATMPPVLAYSLFQAYQNGREHYTEINREKGKTSKVICTWFDETQKPIDKSIDIFQNFKTQHSDFVEKRIAKLREKQALCRGKLLPVNGSPSEALDTVSKAIHQGIHQLHKNNNQIMNSKTISIGLVRMANINPLVATAKKLLSYAPDKGYQIYYCIYHGKYPLALRSYIENKLDWILNRKAKINDKDEKKRKEVWKEYINDKISNSDATNHIFVVLATSVAEVGRDHDYDWAVAEPSSMRSIIQLSGRIQRHRKQESKCENMLILSKNFKALKLKKPAYCKPGFETSKRALFDHDIKQILKPENYENINSIPRIDFDTQKEFRNDKGEYIDLLLLEHYALLSQLLGFEYSNYATLWWDKDITWCGEIQKNQRFREKSILDSVFYLYQHDSNSILKWKEKNNYTHDEYTNKINNQDEFFIETGNSFWLNLDIKGIYEELVTEKRTIAIVSEKFGELRLEETTSENPWHWHPQLGVYKDIGEH